MSRASIVTVGAVTCAGVGVEPLAAALADSGFAPSVGLDRPDAEPLPVARCHTFDPRAHLPPLVARRLDRPARLLAVAAREALASLGETLPWPTDRVGICAGTWNAGTAPLVEVLRTVFTVAPDEAPPAQFPSTVANAPASQLGILESLGGPNLTFFEKQVGGARAVAEGARLLARSRADAVVACGVDEAQWLNAEGYARLRALAGDGRPGMLLAEGAAVLVLEPQAARRPLAVLAGTGSWAVPCATHLYPTSPEPVRVACEKALAEARIQPREIDLVVAMDNGSPTLGALEVTALLDLFGSHRPALVAPAARLGEGAFAAALRILIAALVVGGRATVAWPAPTRLAEAGFASCRATHNAALVCSLAAGGSAVAAVVTRP